MERVYRLTNADYAALNRQIKDYVDDGEGSYRMCICLALDNGIELGFEGTIDVNRYVTPSGSYDLLDDIETIYHAFITSYWCYDEEGNELALDWDESKLDLKD